MTSSLTQSLAGKKILVAEDITDNQLLVKLYLRSTGAVLILANEGQEVLDLVKEEEPDLILMDIQMPDIDGYDCTTLLKKAGFAKPIVAMTAHAMAHEVQRCFQVGCSDVLIKPFRKIQLLDVLHKHLTEPPLTSNANGQPSLHIIQ